MADRAAALVYQSWGLGLTNPLPTVTRFTNKGG
ncbi:hypothetical protein MPL3356_110412 [Mesorhizobium plurifarium]|uniref:Uncharacterized protein n=1 Tax=Mesorhizobium plurifarium TaxID=69974 RepID=A0A090DGD5_MESPL|nr:hypothetical protein MPL3356_110412 [Mesorhizobium plurifarium]